MGTNKRTGNGVRYRWGALALAAATLIAACGGDNEDDASSTTSPVSESLASAAPSTATDAGDTSASPVSEPAAGGVTPEWDSIVAAAREEGKVVLYAVNFPEQNVRLEEAFESAYPEIDLEVVRVLGEIDSKLDSERETGTDGADISFGVNYPWVLNAEAQGDLAPIEIGPNVEEWVGTPWLDPERNFLVGTTQVLGFGWNTELLEGDLPQTWEDLLDPRFAGMIGFTEPASPVIADFWSFAEEQLGGEEGLRRLAELDPLFYASGVPLMQGLGSGEIAVTGYASAQLKADQENGAPVEFFVPKPAWTSANLVYIPAWAKRPNAAQVLADFIASPEGQEALAINGASPLDGIESALVDIDDVQVVDITRTREWAEEYIARWSEIFGR